MGPIVARIARAYPSGIRNTSRKTDGGGGISFPGSWRHGCFGFRQEDDQRDGDRAQERQRSRFRHGRQNEGRESVRRERDRVVARVDYLIWRDYPRAVFVMLDIEIRERRASEQRRIKVQRYAGIAAELRR